MNGFDCIEPEGIELNKKLQKELEDWRRGLPKSKLTHNQKIKIERTYQDKPIWLEISWDDECNNGHNTFSFVIWSPEFSIPGETGIVQEVFPEFYPYMKWHGITSDGPLYYFDNTRYILKHNGLEAAQEYAYCNECSEEFLNNDKKMYHHLKNVLLCLKQDIEKLGFTY